MYILALAASLSGHEIVFQEPTPPSRLETSLVATCEGHTIRVGYRIENPGPDSFNSISVDERIFGESELVRLNEMMLDIS